MKLSSHPFAVLLATRDTLAGIGERMIAMQVNEATEKVRRLFEAAKGSSDPAVVAAAEDFMKLEVEVPDEYAGLVRVLSALNEAIHKAAIEEPSEEAKH